MSEPMRAGWLRPCPWCGREATQQYSDPKEDEVSCIDPGCGWPETWKRWQTAYCWFELDKRNATIRALGEALENIHDIAFDGDGLSAKDLGKDIAQLSKEALALIKGEGKSIPESEENKKEKHHGGTGSITI